MNEWIGFSGSAIPLYLQLSDQLRQQILDGVFPPGEAIPSEADLIARYGVSRITVRQAITLLVEEGLAKRVQGKGTFVQPLSVERNFLDLHSFAKDLLREGHEPSFKILDYDLIPAPPFFRDTFHLNDGDLLHSIRRIKLSDGRPVMADRLFIPHALAPDLTAADVEKEWIAQILTTRYGVEMKRVRKTLQPIIIGHAEAALLGVSPRSLGLLVDRITYPSKDAPDPVLVTRSIVPADATRFFVDIDGDQDIKHQ